MEVIDTSKSVNKLKDELNANADLNLVLDTQDDLGVGLRFAELYQKHEKISVHEVLGTTPRVYVQDWTPLPLYKNMKELNVNVRDREKRLNEQLKERQKKKQEQMQKEYARATSNPGCVLMLGARFTLCCSARGSSLRRQGGGKGAGQQGRRGDQG